MADRAEQRERLGIAAAIAGTSGAIAYVAQRLYERSQGAPVDPRLIIYDPHVAFHGRALAATWFGGIAFALAIALLTTPARRERAARALALAAVPLGVLLSIAALAWP